MSATISITETQVFTALAAVLGSFGLAPANPDTVLEIIKGQVNRVPEPSGPDFIVMWPVLRERLALNVETVTDSQVTGSITGNVLTVTAVGKGALVIGAALWPLNAAAPIATVLRQLTGVPGALGTYAITPTADATSAVLYCGTRQMEEDTSLTVQVDVHGPASLNNVSLLEAQWRSARGCEACAGVGQGIIAPLYSSQPRQLAFENAEQQLENRWSIDLCMQVNPVVTVPQQFADHVEVTVESIETLAA